MSASSFTCISPQRAPSTLRFIRQKKDLRAPGQSRDTPWGTSVFTGNIAETITMTVTVSSSLGLFPEPPLLLRVFPFSLVATQSCRLLSHFDFFPYATLQDAPAIAFFKYLRGVESALHARIASRCNVRGILTLDSIGGSFVPSPHSRARNFRNARLSRHANSKMFIDRAYEQMLPGD